MRCPCPHCTASSNCDERDEYISEREDTFEWKNDVICKRCHERHVDEAEADSGGER